MIAPGAHRAGLERDVERAAGQAVVAERAGRVAQRRDLGVRGRVVARDRRVAAAADDRAVADDDRADRDLAARRRRPRERERLAHPGRRRLGADAAVAAAAPPAVEAPAVGAAAAVAAGTAGVVTAIEARLPGKGRSVQHRTTTASASISTRISGAISRDTSTSVQAGRMRAEDLAVRASDRLPVRDVDDVDARAHDVGQRRAGARKRRVDVRDRLHRLRVRVAPRRRCRPRRRSPWCRRRTPARRRAPRASSRRSAPTARPTRC